MRQRTLGQLVRLARALLDECRRMDAEAGAALHSLEQRRDETAHQRRLVLSGAAGLSSQAVAECTLALDRREDRLREEIAQAQRRVEETHRRVVRAHREERALERLGETWPRAATLAVVVLERVVDRIEATEVVLVRGDQEAGRAAGSLLEQVAKREKGRPEEIDGRDE